MTMKTKRFTLVVALAAASTAGCMDFQGLEG